MMGSNTAGQNELSGSRATTQEMKMNWEGRILALPPLNGSPDLFPVMIAAGFFQGTEVAQACGCPKLSRSLEATLALPTSRFDRS
jgi:hypothetical protein